MVQNVGTSQVTDIERICLQSLPINIIFMNQPTSTGHFLAPSQVHSGERFTDIKVLDSVECFCSADMTGREKRPNKTHFAQPLS